MAIQTKRSRVESRDLLKKGPLMYLNYPRQYRQQLYEHLLTGSKLEEYRPHFDEHTLKTLAMHKQSVSSLLKKAADANTKTGRKLREIALAKAYKELYDRGETRDFQKAVQAIWGSPDKELFYQLLHETLAQASRHNRDGSVLKEVKKLFILKPLRGEPQPSFVRIDAGLFKGTKSPFTKAFADEISILKRAVSKKPFIHRYNGEEISHLLDLLLRHYGLDKLGWQIQSDSKTERVMVNYDSKTINVARGSFRLSRPRAMGLALHEIAVHALSRKNIGRNGKPLGQRRIIEEGLGIFVEQMMFRRFQAVRSLRYIGLCLALGYDGKPRDAREVYEIIWRLRYLGGVAKNKNFAKEYAAKEVARVFRGMPPNQKGVVITKDRAYVEGNQLIWAHIQKEGPEFIFEKLLGKSL